MRRSVRQKTNPPRGATAQPSPTSNHQGIAIVICILLVGVVWVVFGQTLRHEFLNYDDDQYVYDNPRITNGLSLGNVAWAFTHVHAENWHPLTTISHMLDCQLYGLQPWGHHLTNVLLHTTATILLFLALWELTQACWPSAFVTAVFAIHPLRISSVAWVAERKDVLSGVFFMLSLWAYARYARNKGPSVGGYVRTLVFFALGLLCKPTLVTLPFVLLLLDYWPLRRFTLQSSGSVLEGSMRKQAGLRHGKTAQRNPDVRATTIQGLLVEKVPFFVLSAGSCIATLLAQEKTLMGTSALTFGERLSNAMVSYLAYLREMIWPARLAVLYPYPIGTSNITYALVAALILLIISVVVVIWRTKFPYWLVGWLWYLGMLVPMIGLIQVGSQARADRYTYLAQIGLYILITWSAVEFFAKWRRAPAALITVAALIITTLTAYSYVQTSFWRDDETLWRQTLANTSDNPLAENNLGNALLKRGKPDEAVVHYREAIRLYPPFPEAYNSLGHALMKKGQLDEAIAHIRKALELKPDYVAAKYQLAFTLGAASAKQGKWEESINSYRVALEIRPNDPIAHNNLATSLIQAGKREEAIEQLGEALRLDPNYQTVHYNLAMLLLQVGRRDEAVTHLKEALRLNPNDGEVKTELRQLGVGP